MTDLQIEQALEKAVGPYLLGFCTAPANAVFKATARPTFTVGSLTLSAADKSLLQQNTELMAHLSRSFDKLSYYVAGAGRKALGVRLS